MKYNFTDRVRRSLAMAREAAIELDHSYVGTEHILLGLLQQEEGRSAELLRALGVDREVVRARVLESVRPGEGTVAAGKLPYTSRGKKTLEYAMAEARDLEAPGVGTEHLLIGLVREAKGIAGQVLESVGVTLPAARAGHLSRGRRADADDADDVWFLQIDADADAPIYEQIIARIEEAVATGRLATGERLPPIRQLAEELAVAPGTVARAYSELEERGVLETEGARGTRVAARSSSTEAAEERAHTLEGLLRPVVVAAYHMGATAEQIRKAVERAMKGIYGFLA